MPSQATGSSATISAEQLMKCRPFRGINLADARMIMAAASIQHFDVNTTILEEGKSAQALWLIVAGECRVVRQKSDGTERLLATIQAGDVFGEMSFVRHGQHSASIQAVTPVTVLVYTREDFCILAESHPTAAYHVTSNIAAVLAERLFRMDSWTCELVDRPEANAHRDEWQTFRSTVYSNWDF